VSDRVGRAALALIALAILVPLCVWLLAAVRYERALERVESAGARQAADRIRSDLRSAARLTPSTEPEVAVGQLELFLGRPDKAARELRAVVRREPDNASAWGLLSIALEDADPAAAERASRREVELRGGFARGR
jgi:predicted Zn-dependent protease